MDSFLELPTPVEVVVIVGDRARRVSGIIVGRTYQSETHYDVRLETGELLQNVHHSRVHEMGAA